jgi:uracil-DNA glycosylase family 4
VAEVARTLTQLAADVTACRACPRLVRYGATIAPRAAFAGQIYAARPVAGFGDPAARLVVVGLAPAAHGAHRTGRVFTGDRSGDFLYAALHRAGLASQPHSVSADDGLRLRGVWITVAVRCAPPDNKPSPAERDRCLPFLRRELAALPARTILALGAFAWEATLEALEARGPAFAHGGQAEAAGYRLFGSYHVSQQNTFTGRLTPAMFDAILVRALA